MLFAATGLVDAVALGLTFWMALYLLARGHSSLVTRRTVIVLLILSLVYLSAYAGLYGDALGAASFREVILVVGLGLWYSVTFQLISPRLRQRLRGLNVGVLILCAAAAIVLLVAYDHHSGVPPSAVYIWRLAPGLPSFLYVAALLIVAPGVLYNLLSGSHIGLSLPGRYFMIASVFIAIGVVYASRAYSSATPLPRVVVDVLLLGVVLVLATSVARHQALVERRMDLRDFSITGLAMLCITLLYAGFALRWGLPMAMLAALSVIVILTHSAYDLVREFLVQLHLRRESSLRRHLHELEQASYDEESLDRRLQIGLALLCQSMHATGGFIAVRRSPGEVYTVVAQKRSLVEGSQFPPSLVACEDVTAVTLEDLPGIAWIAPAFEAQEQTAVVCLRPPAARMDYSAGDLDLLTEFTDHVATIVALSNRRPIRTVELRELIDASQIQASRLQLSADELLAAAAANIDPEFVRALEDALRHLADYDALGKSPLVTLTRIGGGTHIEKGRNLNLKLKDAIDSLRPGPEKPSGTLPREWYAYVVLHEAYVRNTPNRQIMNRLYISEGTFNRTRRSAIRGVARLLMDSKGPSVGAASARPDQTMAT